MTAKVIPLKRRRPRASARVIRKDDPQLAGLAELELAHGYADPVAGIAMQADLSARVVHVIVGRGNDPVELAWTPEECRRTAAELLRLADDAEGRRG